jgi:hypothetical protein
VWEKMPTGRRNPAFEFELLSDSVRSVRSLGSAVPVRVAYDFPAR